MGEIGGDSNGVVGLEVFLHGHYFFLIWNHML